MSRLQAMQSLKSPVRLRATGMGEYLEFLAGRLVESRAAAAV